MTYITEAALASSGGCYVSSSAASAAITAETYIILAGTTTTLTLKNFTHTSPGRLTYTGIETLRFIVNVALSFISTQSNELARFRFAKNGTTLAGSQINRKLGTGSDEGALSIAYELELATNDYIEVYCTLAASTSDTITANTMVMVVIC